MKRVNILDDTELREVFFGESNTGKSYAVLCHSDENTSTPISSVFQEAHGNLPSTTPIEFRLLDCNFILPSSGKSIADRFNLNLKKRPTIFLSGTVGAPKQIDEKHLKTGKMLVNYLRGKVEVRAAKIETTQDLRSKCLDKNICALLLKGTTKAPAYLKDAMNKLLKEFPNVSFAALDASVLYAKNLEEHLPELQNEQPRFVVFKKVSGSIEAGGDRLKTSISAIPNLGVSYGQMSNLVGDVVSGKAEMRQISTLPVIKTRTKKLEEEERAKRQRRNEQQQRQSSGQKEESPRGSFEANDGSKEGRRAERERRRNEHREKNNVREKTPEEIAEMERKRRQRMEDEAQKWNMAPEDAPEEGDFFEEEPIDETFEDETSIVEEDTEDEDDVIDLD